MSASAAALARTTPMGLSLFPLIAEGMAVRGLWVNASGHPGQRPDQDLAEHTGQHLALAMRQVPRQHPQPKESYIHHFQFGIAVASLRRGPAQCVPGGE